MARKNGSTHPSSIFVRTLRDSMYSSTPHLITLSSQLTPQPQPKTLNQAFEVVKTSQIQPHTHAHTDCVTLEHTKDSLFSSLPQAVCSSARGKGSVTAFPSKFFALHYCVLLSFSRSFSSNSFVDDDDFTHSAHSLMTEVPGIQAHVKTVIVWLTWQSIARKFHSRVESGSSKK